MEISGGEGCGGFLFELISAIAPNELFHYKIASDEVTIFVEAERMPFLRFKGSTIQTRDRYGFFSAILVLNESGIASLTILTTYSIIPLVADFENITLVKLNAHGVMMCFKVVVVTKTFRQGPVIRVYHSQNPGCFFGILIGKQN